MNFLWEINCERIVLRNGLQVRVGGSAHDDEWCDE